MDAVKKKKAQAFWAWFMENHLMYEFLPQMEAEQLYNCLNAIEQAVHSFSKHLYINISPAYESDSFMLVITTRANTAAFEEAKALLKEAPTCPKNWFFHALTPPLPEGVRIRQAFQKGFLYPADIWFVFLQHLDYPEQTGVRIFLPHYDTYDSEVQNELRQHMCRFMCKILGEEAFANRIHFIDLAVEIEDMQERGFSKLNNIRVALQKFEVLSKRERA